MIYLRTGLPGGGKTLNSFKEIVENPKYSTKPKYYTNVRLLMLDIDVCNSFSGWFYGVFYEDIPQDKRVRYDLIIKSAHQEERFVSEADVPWLIAQYKCFTEFDALNLFLTWVRKLYPKEQLEKLERLFELSEQPTVDDVKSLNYHFTYFEDATDWYNLPNGSVIFIDEAQQFFPVKSAGSSRPVHYEKFQVHRHSGYDIHLVTQEKGFIDFKVRSLANYHVHYQRPFTGKGIVRYEKDGIFSPEDRDALATCKTKPMKRDSNFYGLYWSADEHTHEFKLPKIILLLPVMLAIFIGILYYLFNGGVTDLISNAPKDSDISVVKPVSTPAATGEPNRSTPKTNKTPQLIHISTQTLSHPLDTMCTRFEYSGNNVIHKDGVYIVEHYISCFTDDVETVTNFNDDGTSSDITYPVVRTLTSNYLKNLGYNIALNNRTPVIVYQGTKLVLDIF